MIVCLYFVVPCYNDSDTISVSVPVFLQKLDALIDAGTISDNSRLMLVNDGSADDTWNTILALRQEDARITAVNLAHNVGEQNALLAGMFTAMQKADCVITMDSDLQDDISAVDEMLKHYRDGCQIVYGVHESRKKDSASERFFAGAFYTLMRFAGTGLIKEHANYRLMSKNAIEQLFRYKNTYLYLPCVVSRMNVKSAVVYHDRFERAAGHTAYSFWKKMRLALHALSAHSPLSLLCCGIMSLVCFVCSAVFALQSAMPAGKVFCCVFAILGILFSVLLFCAVCKKSRGKGSALTSLFEISEVLE